PPPASEASEPPPPAPEASEPTPAAPPAPDSSEGGDRVDPDAPPYPEELQDLAAENPGGWVYDIEPGQQNAEVISASHIRGAWRIDDRGSPTGEYVPNRQYRAPVAPVRRRRRWLWLLALVIVALAVAAVVLL